MLTTLLASPLVSYGLTLIAGLASYPAVHAVVSKIESRTTSALESRIAALEAKLPKV